MSGITQLNDSDLENVSGGVLTPEAEDWINRNYEAIYNKAPWYLQALVQPALNYLNTTEKQYDIKMLKSELKNNYSIDVDDLM